MSKDEEEEESATSWEAKAEQLFSLCDKESKGFITKRDLQRLWGELPLGPDELEGVFDSLDQDQNGFLTLEEFIDGFGHHLGLVVEFRAECNMSDRDSAEDEGCKQKDDDSTSSSTRQLDEILNVFAKHDFNISSTVVEAVWRDICQVTNDSPDGTGLEKIVASLLHELARVKSEHNQLEAALAAKSEQYNQQVAHLYEELESQINGERNKAAAEHSHKESRALASLEQEVRDREALLKQVQDDYVVLLQRLERLKTVELATKQENERLNQHLNKLEEDLAHKEREVKELSSTLDHLKKNSKEEKIKKYQRAMKVSEGIALERESLVTQLHLLRTINTQLRDEHDQAIPVQLNSSQGSRKSGEGSGILRLDSPASSAASCNTSIEPTAACIADIVAVSAAEAEAATVPSKAEIAAPANAMLSKSRDTTKLLPPDRLNLCFSEASDRKVIDTSQTINDVEHDDLYFMTTRVNSNIAQEELTVLPTAEGTSLLQEILQSPNLCTSCGGAFINMLSADRKPKVKFQRRDSVTQTSPETSLSNENLPDTSKQIILSARSPDVVKPAKLFAEMSELESQGGSTVAQKPKICSEKLSDPNVTKNIRYGR